MTTTNMPGLVPATARDPGDVYTREELGFGWLFS
jgi:hypothetical protein